MNPEGAPFRLDLPEVLRATPLTVGTVAPGSLDDQVLCLPGPGAAAQAGSSLSPCTGVGHDHRAVP